MGSEHQPLKNVGIYRNLPTFDPSIKGLNAIVTGANGISGFHTMRVLLQSPERWSNVFALSRKPPPEAMMKLLTADERSRVKHVAIDFLQPSSEIAAALNSGNVDAQYIFYYSYLQPRPDPASPASHAWSNADELAEVNSSMLRNFIEGLKQTSIKPKRFLLQTGAKNYGIHLGRIRTPANESDPQPQHLETNFYYHQEPLLFSYCQTHSIGWTIIMPAWIVGSATSAQINGLHPFSVYAAVQAHKNEPLEFPSDFDSWQYEAHHATARLTGYLSEWAVLEDKCRDQRFNAQDTSPLSWDRFFHELARWYGAKKGVVAPTEAEKGKLQVVEGKGGVDCPLGYGPGTTHRVAFSLVEWAGRAENRRAWEEIMQASGGRVTADPFEEPRDFGMGDGVLARLGTLNMNKARRMGWTGYVDTIESVFEMYQENAKLGLVPGMVVETANPMV